MPYWIWLYYTRKKKNHSQLGKAIFQCQYTKERGKGMEFYCQVTALNQAWLDVNILHSHWTSYMKKFGSQSHLEEEATTANTYLGKQELFIVCPRIVFTKPWAQTLHAQIWSSWRKRWQGHSTLTHSLCTTWCLRKTISFLCLSKILWLREWEKKNNMAGRPLLKGALIR